MATIRPVQTPSVQVAPLQVAKQGVTVPTQRIGNGVSEGLMNLGQSIEDINARVNETKVVQAETEFYRRVDDVLFNKDNGYYNSKGESAFNGVPDVNKRIEDIKKEFLDSLANDQQRNNFSLLADKRITNDRRNISVHASKELDVWDRAASDARIEQAVESATLDYSVQSITENVIRMEDEIHDQSNKQGVAPNVRNERLQTARSKLYASAIINAANGFDIESARALQAQYGEFLEPDEKALVDEKILTIDRAKSAQDLADTIRAEGGTRSERLAKVNNEPDPEKRKLAKSQVISDYDQEEMAKSEREAGAFDEIRTLMLAGVPNELTLRKANPVAFDAMSIDAKEAVRKYYTEGEVKTDMDAYFELTRLLKVPGGQKQATKYYLDNRHLFGDTDSKFFAKAVQEPEKQQGLFDAQDYVQSYLKDVADADMKREFMSQFDHWYIRQRNLNNGDDPSSDEVKTQVDSMVEKVDPGMWSFEKPAYQVGDVDSSGETKALQDATTVYAEVFGEEPDPIDLSRIQQFAIHAKQNGGWPTVDQWRQSFERYKNGTP